MDILRVYNDRAALLDAAVRSVNERGRGPISDVLQHEIAPSARSLDCPFCDYTVLEIRSEFTRLSGQK